VDQADAESTNVGGDPSALLAGRSAVVTGAARGVGRATAELLTAHGARVLISDIDADLARQAASEIGAGTVAFGGDLTEAGVPERLVEAAAEQLGGIDIVVNNAGVSWDGVVHKMSDRQFQAMLDIHTVAPFRILRAAAPYLREPAKEDREAGREVFRKVVNVTSISGVMGNAGQANYSSAKAGLVGLTKSLAKEWGPLKINVNAVSFGGVETRMTGPQEESNAATYRGERVQLGLPERVLQRPTSNILFGRRATTREAAGPILFLCSPLADFVHGQVLNVTGGQVVGMSA
jgi:3-oxoacyl-[acyl-carrier protein] reductase